MRNGTCERLGCRDGRLFCHDCLQALKDVREVWLEKRGWPMFPTHACTRCLVAWRQKERAGWT